MPPSAPISSWRRARPRATSLTTRGAGARVSSVARRRHRSLPIGEPTAASIASTRAYAGRIGGGRGVRTLCARADGAARPAGQAGARRRRRRRLRARSRRAIADAELTGDVKRLGAIEHDDMPRASSRSRRCAWPRRADSSGPLASFPPSSRHGLPARGSGRRAGLAVQEIVTTGRTACCSRRRGDGSGAQPGRLIDDAALRERLAEAAYDRARAPPSRVRGAPPPARGLRASCRRRGRRGAGGLADRRPRRRAPDTDVAAPPAAETVRSRRAAPPPRPRARIHIGAADGCSPSSPASIVEHEIVIEIGAAPRRSAARRARAGVQRRRQGRPRHRQVRRHHLAARLRRRLRRRENQAATFASEENFRVR